MKTIIRASIVTMLMVPMPATAEGITLIDARDRVWEATAEGVSFAALQGDRFEGAYQALVRLPAGTASPLHVKSANMYGIMLQGVMVHYAADQKQEAARQVGVGSFYNISSGTAHISACVSDVPCIVYLYQDGAFDFVPVHQ